ncbi:MAG: Crp/Fnr family transcriptional regulator [Chitinophagaceae bacterium]|nr:MAG: Crp/Fnr family transcriptional regulator [Chitinophagaceae bacterium]
MVSKIKEYIGRFLTLTPEEWNTLAETFEVRTCDKKVKLLEVGEVENYIHFVVKGLARKYFYKDGEEIITQLAKEGELISSSVSFLSTQPSVYVVETIEPKTFISISKTQIESFYSKDQRWEKLGRLIITELFLEKEKWELERICYSTRERFVRFVSSNYDLFQRVPQKYLASYLNIKPETFSRLKHLLQKKPTSNIA